MKTDMELVSLSEVLTRSGVAIDIDPAVRYRVGGIRSHGKGIFERESICGSETKYSTYWRLATGQLIFSKLFAWEGAVAVASDAHEGLHFSSEFPVFDCNESRLLPEFASYLARWPGLHDQLRDEATGLGNRRQRVNPDRFLSVKVPLPKPPEQRRIVQKLDLAFGELAALVARRRKIEDALQPSLLNATFTGRL